MRVQVLLRSSMALVIGAVAVLAWPQGAGADTVTIPYTCDGGPIGDLSAPIAIARTSTPQPVDIFQKVTYTADLTLPDIDPQAIAVNFDFFRVAIDIPPGMRAVTVKAQNPAPLVANPAATDIATVISGNQIIVRMPPVTNATRLFRFGLDGNFTYPFNAFTSAGGAPVVLPRLKITAMPTFAAGGATIDWAAPEVGTYTVYFNIHDIPCAPDDPSEVLFSSTVTNMVRIPANGYSDVPTSLDPAVNWARHLEITNFSGTTFKPSQALTRAEAVRSLWNMVDRPAATSQHPFIDVPANATYDAALDWAFSEGIVPNPANHKFKPNSPALRGALVDMVFHMIQAQEASPWPAEPYTDVAASAPYAEAMGWANATNTINEFAGGTQVRPTVAATRADIARILFKTAKNQAWFRSLPTTVLVNPA